jgi:hypothetical protein
VRYYQSVDAGVLPPSSLVTGAVDLAMMSAAQRYGELVAYLEAETASLREAQMMGVAGPPFTDQAGLFGDKSKVDLVAKATGLRNGEQALVDSARSSFLTLRSLLNSRSFGPVLMRLRWWTRRARRGGRVRVCKIHQSGLKRFLDYSRVVDSQGVFDRQASVGPLGKLFGGH